MIAGNGYGFGRSLGAQGYGFAYAIVDHDGKHRIRKNGRDEEEFMCLVAMILPLITRRRKWPR